MNQTSAMRYALALTLGAGCVLLAASDAVAVTLDQRESAAAWVAEHDPRCTAIRPFYWEIGFGGSSDPIEHGSVGDNAPIRTTNVNIASATKWLYAAYIAEKLAQYYAEYDEYQDLPPQTPEPVPLNDVKYLTMTSGYRSLHNDTCQGVNQLKTVYECLHSANGGGGYNDDYTAVNDGNFWYNGGHFEEHAIIGSMLLPYPQSPTPYPPTFAVDLSSDGKDDLPAELESVLGPHSLTFSNSLLASGVNTSSADYAGFLRQILNGELEMRWLLGMYAVPAVCADGQYDCTPIPDTEVWHYALGHWVEDDPNNGDGAFSSGGATGFYPWVWIDPTNPDNNAWYGIIARPTDVTAPTSGIDEDASIGWPSILCGRAIRAAWLYVPVTQ